MSGLSGSKKCHVVRKESEEFEFFLSVDEDRKGQIITSVTKGGPADRAGLKDGDRVVEINGKNVEQNDHGQIVALIRECVPKKEITFLVIDEDHDPNVKKPAPVAEIVTAPQNKSTNADTRPRLCKIKKKNNSFGIFLTAGSNSGHFIKQVTEGGAADGTGLRVRDRVIAVNKVNVEKMKHARVAELIKKSGNKVALLVIDEEGYQELKKRNIPITEKMVKSTSPAPKKQAAPSKASKSSSKTPAAKSSPNQGKVRVVHILKHHEKGYGFFLQSKKPFDGEFIGDVDADSAANHSGLLKDDRVMAVNGKSIVGMAHGDVIALIKAKKAQVVLVVMDDLARKHFEEKDNFPSASDIARSHNHMIRSVKLTKGNKGYGMFLKMEKGCPFHIFADVEKGGVAAKAGLKNGEIVIAVEGSSVLTESHDNCVKKIKDAGSSVEMIVGSREASHFLHKTGVAIGGDLLQEWPTEEELTVPSFGKTAKGEMNAKPVAAAASVVKEVADKSDALGMKPRLCRVVRGDKGFGFNMKEDKGHIFANIDKSGPAFQAGVLDFDRVVEINGENVEKLTHAEVVSKIRESGAVVTFLVVNKEEDKFFKEKGVTVTSTLLLDADGELADEHRPRICRLVRTASGYGFHLMAQPGREGQFIKDFAKGGAADVGGLREGDRIIEVNGTNVVGESHDVVVKKITEMKDEVTFLVIDKEGDAYYRIRNTTIVAGLSVAKAVAEKPDVEEESVGRASVSSSVIETEATVHQEPESDEEDLEARKEVVEDEKHLENENDSDRDAERENKVEEIKERLEELDDEEQKRLAEEVEKTLVAATAAVEEIREEDDSSKIPEEFQEDFKEPTAEDVVENVEELVQEVKDEDPSLGPVEKIVVAAAVKEVVEEVRENGANESESDQSRPSTPEPAKEEESPAIVSEQTREEVAEVIEDHFEDKREEEQKDEMNRAQKVTAALVMKEIADKVSDKGDGSDSENEASSDEKRDSEPASRQKEMKPAVAPPTPPRAPSPPPESPKPVVVVVTKPAARDVHKESPSPAAVSLATVLNGSVETPKLKPVQEPDNGPKAPWAVKLKPITRQQTVGQETTAVAKKKEEPSADAPLSSVAAMRLAIEKRNREAQQQQSSAQKDVKNELEELSKQRAAAASKQIQQFGGGVKKPTENGSAKKKNPWVGEGMTIKIIET